MAIVVSNRAGSFELSLVQWRDGSVSLVQTDQSRARKAICTISQVGDLVFHGELSVDSGLRVNPETGEALAVLASGLGEETVPEILTRDEQPLVVRRDGRDDLPAREDGLTRENEKEEQG